MEDEFAVDPLHDFKPQGHRDNPLIEALGPIKSDSEVKAIFERPINYHPAQRNLDDGIRLQCINGLRNYQIYLEKHLELYRAIDNTIRDGYIGRHPGGIHAAQSFEALYNIRTGPVVCASRRQKRNLAQLSIALIGVAGMGKTSAINCIADSYPDYIQHRDWHCFQVPFLPLEIPSKGYSIFAMADNVYHSLDERIQGATYYQTYGKTRVTEDRVPGVMGIPLTACHVGLMLWEEAQRMAKVMRNKEDLSNVVVFTGNTLKTPIGFSGTPEARDVINRSLSSTRRMQGLPDWEPMPEKEHFAFLDQLWIHDYTRATPPMNEHRHKLLRACSAGVIDIDILLFQSCQRAAILQKRECISDKLIREVMASHFHSFAPFIAALHHKRYDLLSGMKEHLLLLRDKYSSATVEDLLATDTSAADLVGKPNASSLLNKLGSSDDFVGR